MGTTVFMPAGGIQNITAIANYERFALGVRFIFSLIIRSSLTHRSIVWIRTLFLEFAPNYFLVASHRRNVLESLERDT
jgi:hypothetical protein